MVIVWNGICLNERSWKVPRLPTSIDACKVFAGTMHLVRELCTTGSQHSRMEGSQQTIARNLDVHQPLSLCKCSFMIGSKRASYSTNFKKFPLLALYNFSVGPWNA